MTGINMSIPDAVCTFIILSHLILYKTRNAASCICRGNQITYLGRINLFPKIVPSMRYCGNVWNSGQTTDKSILWSMVYACSI